MQKKFKKIIVIISIIIIIIIIFKTIYSKNILQNSKMNDYTFLKFFSSKTSEKISKKESIEYEFDVKYNNIDFKSINLLNTVDKEKLLYEKIAPGTSGNFNIVIDSNKNLKYKIIFNSKNEKPQNLKFIAYIDSKIVAETETLEKLSQYLTGNIVKNKKVNIKIYWYWKYEEDKNTEETDIQDTEDAKKIEQYKFDIITVGEQY